MSVKGLGITVFRGEIAIAIAFAMGNGKLRLIQEISILKKIPAVNFDL